MKTDIWPHHSIYKFMRYTHNSNNLTNSNFSIYRPSSLSAHKQYVRRDDEDRLDVINGDDDGQNGHGSVNGLERRREDLHVGDNGVTHRVVIDRGCYSMTEFHEQHGYHRKDKLNPKEFVQRKIKRCRCGVDKFLGKRC